MHPSIDPPNMTGHPEEKPCPYLCHSLCDCVERWQSGWVAGWEDGVHLLEVGTMLGSCIYCGLFPWPSYHEKTVFSVLRGNWGSETIVNLSKISHLRSSGTWLQMWRLYSCPLCSTTSPSFCSFPRQEAIQSHSPPNFFCLTDFSSGHQITHTRCL